MRKITRDAVAAFYGRENFSRSNTKVTHDYNEGITEMYLFGKLIARRSESGRVTFTMAGYPTDTTRERLSGVLDRKGFSVKQVSGEQFLWNGHGQVKLEPEMWYEVR